MIKFALRRNLIYPLQAIIWHFVRNLETILIGYIFNFNNSLVYTPIMFIGEFISGLIIFLYQESFLKKEKSKPKIFSLTLIYNPQKIKSFDSNIKIMFLISFIAVFDWIQFLIWTTYLPKFIKISGSIVNRLSGILAISSAIFYCYDLRLPIFKHHIFCLIIVGVCTFIIIFTEFIFQEISIFVTYSDLIIVLLLSALTHILNGFLDAAEKYLFEIDLINPFIVLMYEGIFGFFFSFFYFFIPNYLDDIKIVYKTFSAGNLVLFTFLLFIYIILSGGRNVFRVVTNKIYSPVARALTDYFLNPLLFIFDYSMGNDFLNQGKRNILYFLINLIISFIILICGFIYNEFMILFCCDLEINTHDQISKRAETQVELSKMFEDTEDEDD